MTGVSVFVRYYSGLIATESKSRCEGGLQSKKFDEVLHHDDASATLHHMIPWEVLGRALALAVNRALDKTSPQDDLLQLIMAISQPYNEFHSATDFDNTKKALKTLSTVLPKSKDYAKPIIVDVRDGWQPRCPQSGRPSNHGEYIVSLVHHWCWMPGNLFTGSANRKDDPGSWGFDFPPTYACRMDQPETKNEEKKKIMKEYFPEVVFPSREEAVSGETFKERYEDLYDFWRLMITSTDDELCNGKLSDLKDILATLVLHDLSNPRRLIVAKGKFCWDMSSYPYKKKKPAAITKIMQEELRIHGEIHSKGGHEAWSKRHAKDPVYVVLAAKKPSIEK